MVSKATEMTIREYVEALKEGKTVILSRGIASTFFQYIHDYERELPVTIFYTSEKTGFVKTTAA